MFCLTRFDCAVHYVERAAQWGRSERLLTVVARERGRLFTSTQVRKQGAAWTQNRKHAMYFLKATSWIQNPLKTRVSAGDKTPHSNRNRGVTLTLTD